MVRTEFANYTNAPGRIWERGRIRESKMAERKLRADKNVAMVGLISDTHGLLRSEAIEALRGVDLIIHAGDVGAPEVLAALEKIAPVVAVRGNTDTDTWA